jgi:hypothetical protein
MCTKNHSLALWHFCFVLAQLQKTRDAVTAGLYDSPSAGSIESCSPFASDSLQADARSSPTWA